MSATVDASHIGPPRASFAVVASPRVLMISSEVLPFARTGGLGDVLGGLSLALAELGCDVTVVTPRYGVSRVPEAAAWWPRTVTARIGWGRDDVAELGVLETTLPTARGRSVRVCLLDHPNLFWRDGIYGDAYGAFGDNDVRFVAMSRGGLACAAEVWPDPLGLDGGPDVLHAHDWHAASAVISARLTMGPRWRATPCVFTIHNLAFQGVLGTDALDRLALPRAAFDDGTLAHEGQVNFMHGAISLADRVTTVSPTYAGEIQRPRSGFGLDALLRRHREKLVGILNGIDDDGFDPARDPALAARYDGATVREGKAACKAAVAGEFGLSFDGADTHPLFAAVSRLTEQKGVDLLLALIPGLVDRGARFALVGAGDSALEDALRGMAARFPGRVGVRVAFDGTLARRVYAGADFFVVPSRYEPCGLTQLYAMRYGATPVVTSVGGLRDTVTPVSSLMDTGTGFVAPTPTTAELLVACEDALALYRDGEAHLRAVRRAMARDSSWYEPARAYLDLYRSLLAKSAQP